MGERDKGIVDIEETGECSVESCAMGTTKVRMPPDGRCRTHGCEEQAIVTLGADEVIPLCGKHAFELFKRLLDATGHELLRHRGEFKVYQRIPWDGGGCHRDYSYGKKGAGNRADELKGWVTQ